MPVATLLGLNIGFYITRYILTNFNYQEDDVFLLMGLLLGAFICLNIDIYIIYRLFSFVRIGILIRIRYTMDNYNYRLVGKKNPKKLSDYKID